MAVTEPLTGKWATLRCADESDARFTLDIRNDLKLNRFIPTVSSTIDNQILWIQKQRTRDFDCFYVIESADGQRRGTISFYDFDEKNSACELGRYISYGNAMENVDAAVLILDYIFDKLKLKTVVLNIDENNSKVIKFWQRFGAELSEVVPMEGWVSDRYLLTAEKYGGHRSRIAALL